MGLKKVAGWYCVLLLLLVLAISRLPGHNGDMTYYIACTIEAEQHTQVKSLEKAKQELDREMTPADAAIQKARVSDAGPGTLNFYRIKPFYIASIRFFHLLGFGYLMSTLLPSLIAYFVIGLLCFRWAADLFSPLPAALISGLLMLIYPTLILARLSTPDALSNACLLLILYLLFKEANRWLVIALLLASIFIRLDNLVNVAVVLAAMKFRTPADNRIKWVTALAAGAAALMIALFINSWLVTDFWWFRKITYVQSWAGYGHQVLVYCLSVSESALIYLLFLVVVRFSIRRFSWDDHTCQWLLLILGVFGLRFLLFPALEDRFFSAFYIAGFLLLARDLMPAHRLPAEGNSPVFSA